MTYFTNVINHGEGPEQGVRSAGQQTHRQAGVGRGLVTGLSLDTQTLITNVGPGALCIAANKHWIQKGFYYPLRSKLIYLKPGCNNNVFSFSV